MNLERVRRIGRNRLRAQAALRQFTDELHDAVRAALAAGESGTEIAKAAGISRARVYQIRDEV